MARYIQQLRRGWKDDTRDDWATYEAQEDHVKPLEGELVLEYVYGVPRLKIGDGINEFSQLPYMSIDSFVMPTPSYVTLYPELWEQADDNRWYQVVNIENATITERSKVDLQPSAEQLGIFHKKDLAFVAENDDGIVSVYCIGQVPTNQYTIQVTVVEVDING